MSSQTRLHQRAANFEADFVKTIEEHYSVKVPQKADHESSMGGTLDKMKPWKSDTNRSPTK